MTTKSLRGSCTAFDPPVDTYQRAYWNGDRIAIGFSVKEPERPSEIKRADSYWAELRRSQLNPGWHSTEGVTIHRNPIPEEIESTWEQLDIGGVPGPALENSRSSNSPSAEWAPTILVQDGVLHIAYYKTSTTNLHMPRKHIRPESYPKLILLYPFAVIGDVVTLPGVLLSPSFR